MKRARLISLWLIAGAAVAYMFLDLSLVGVAILPTRMAMPRPSPVGVLLRVGHLLELCIIPVVAFAIALPHTPCRWYAYFGAICGISLISKHDWYLKTFFPALVFVVGVVGLAAVVSALAAALRQRIRAAMIGTAIGIGSRLATGPSHTTTRTGP